MDLDFLQSSLDFLQLGLGIPSARFGIPSARLGIRSGRAGGPTPAPPFGPGGSEATASWRAGPGLNQGILAIPVLLPILGWMAGSSPAMTIKTRTKVA